MLNLQQQLLLPALTGLVLVLALSMPTGTAAEVIELTPDNVDQFIPHPDKSVFVYFYASWCGHCVSFAPVFADAAESFLEHSDKVIFAKGDADTHKEFSKFGIQGFPTIKLYTAGEKDINLYKPFSDERTKYRVIDFLNDALGYNVSSDVKVSNAPKKASNLIEAVFDSDTPGFLQLIADGADVNQKKDGMPVIFWAAELGHKDMIKTLVDNGADYSWDPACLIGDVERIAELVGKGQDINQKEVQYGTTCLMLAAEKDFPDVISYLAKKGVDLDAQNVNGNTALMKAAEFGMMSSLRVLVEAGASQLPRNKAGKTAFDVAVAEQKTEIQEYLARNVDVHRVQPAPDSDKHDLPADAEAFAKSDL